MHPIPRQIRRIATLFVMLTTVVAAMPLTGMAQETGEDQKQRCKNGGWQTLTRSDGNAFSNQGECVKYIATLNSNTRDIPDHD